MRTRERPPFGPVRIAIPRRLLAATLTVPTASVTVGQTTYETGPAIDAAVTALADANRPLVLCGGGVRRSKGGPARVAALASLLDAPVAVTAKRKGTFPEDEAQFLGCTGAHLPAGGMEVFEAADVLVALGTDFDGINTAAWTLPQPNTTIAVNLDPASMSQRYTGDIEIVTDVTEACEQLAAGIRDADQQPNWDGARVASASRAEYADQLQACDLDRADGPATTPRTLHAIREALPRETIVATDVGETGSGPTRSSKPTIPRHISPRDRGLAWGSEFPQRLVRSSPIPIRRW